MFNVNQPIEIDKEEYVFEEHPSAPWTAYAQEGRKAIVYKLRRRVDDEPFALKTFKPVFQNSQLVDNTALMNHFNGFAGLTVCRRKCITRKNNFDLVESFPSLEYAILMPWIQGSSWHDIVFQKSQISLDDASRLATKLLTVLSNLERGGYAHCDISNANVIFDCEVNKNEVVLRDDPRLELIDVEDMFGPEFPDPARYPMGTRGYHHSEPQSRIQGQWCAEGDRFSTAIFIGELLCWHDEEFRNAAGEKAESYFGELENLRDPANLSKYQLLVSTLSGIGQPLVDCFESAWNSEELAQCPSIAEWQKALALSLNILARLHSQLKVAIQQDLDQDIIRLGDEIRQNNGSLSEAEWKAFIGAQHKIKAINKLQQAILNGKDIEILAAFDKSITGSLNADQQRRIADANRRIQVSIPLKRAVKEDDDRTICELFDRTLFDASPLLSTDEMLIIERALQRRDRVAALRAAFSTGDPHKIMQVYHAGLQNSNLLTHQDRQQMDEARQKLQLPQPMSTTPKAPAPKIVPPLPHDDKDIIELLRKGQIMEQSLGSQSDRQRLSAALQRHGRILRIQRALQQNDIERVKKLYTSVNLTGSSLLPPPLRQQIEQLLSNLYPDAS